MRLASCAPRPARPTRPARVAGLALFGIALAVAGSACERSDTRGALRIVSFPRAELVVDGRATGKQTPVQAHRLRAGRHEVTLARAGARFERQRVDVRAGRTTHLYFRARDGDSDIGSREVCTSGREDHCWARIDDAMRAGRRRDARVLGEAYLRAHPEGGYALVVRGLVGRLGGDASVPHDPDPE